MANRELHRLEVTGRACGTCGFGVCKVLERVPDLTKADVKYNADYELGAIVIFGSTETGVEALTNAVFWTIALRLDNTAAYLSRTPRTRTRDTWRILPPTPAASHSQDTSA